MPDGQSQLVANGTADASGNVTITFPQVNVGATFSGTLSVPLSELNVNWVVDIDGTQVAAITGASGYGTVQITTSDVLTISATNATPGEQYQAVLRGVLHFAGAPSLIPTPTTVAVNQVSPVPPGLLGSFTGTLGTISGVPDDVRTLIIQITGAVVTTVDVQATVGAGGVTLYNQPPYLGVPLDEVYLIVVPVPAVLNAGGYTVGVSVSAGTPVVTVYGDAEAYEESDFYNGVAQVAIQSLVAAGNALVLPGPARLLSAHVRTSGTLATLNLGTSASGPEIAGAYQNGSQAYSFPPDTILEAGESIYVVQFGAGATAGSIVYAYP